MNGVRRSLAVAAVIAIASLGASACGSSSKSAPAANTPTPATPTTPSTGTSTTSSAAPGEGKLPPATPIDSSTYHNFVVKTQEEKNHKSPAAADAVATCIQNVLVKAGVKTVGDADRLDPAKANQIGPDMLKCLAR
jgi:hypothetical protein